MKKKKQKPSSGEVKIKQPDEKVVMTVPKEELTAKTVCKDGNHHISI